MSSRSFSCGLKEFTDMVAPDIRNLSVLLIRLDNFAVESFDELAAEGCCAVEQLDGRQIIAAVITDGALIFSIPLLFFRRCLHGREHQHCVRQTLTPDLDSPDRRIQLSEFGGSKSNGSRAGVLDHMRHLCRAGDGHDPRLLRHQPRQRDLRRGRLLLLGPFLQESNKGKVVRQILWREP